MPSAPPADTGSETPAVGRCWACGYDLRGVPSGRCPECGRAFDPADRRTTNFGRPMGRLGRAALGPLSWRWVMVAGLGAAAAWASVRWPAGPWRVGWPDLAYYARAWEWRTRAPGLTWVDGAYTAGLGLAALAAFGLVLRAVARGLAAWRYRPPGWQRGRFWRRAGLGGSFLAATVAAGAVGWPYRVGQRWAVGADKAARTAANVPSPPRRGWVSYPPAGTPAAPGPDGFAALDDADQSACARTLARRGDSARLRTWGIKLLVEREPDRAADLLPELYAAERDPDVRALLLRLIGIARRAPDVPLTVGGLADPSPAVRAAAADAVGLMRREVVVDTIGGTATPRGDEVGDPLPLGNGKANDPLPLGSEVASDPPIVNVWLLRRQPGFGAVPPEARAALERMMTAGPTPAEREAAARALVAWPPERYALRAAEWAVLLAGRRSRLESAAAVKEQLDTIPPFVHRVGNPEADFTDRLRYWQNMTVWKPVLHLTADRPLAVHLEVGLHGGRPWLAFPRPDDLTIGPRVFAPGVPREQIDVNLFPGPDDAAGAFEPDPKAFGPLAGLREGYPWLAPEHRTLTPGNRGWGGEVAGYTRGLVWQGLIVSPTRLPWMTVPPVPPDPRLAWWDVVRRVDCSWVSSRGEADRLVYYDGPVYARSPVEIVWEAGPGRLAVTGPTAYSVGHAPSCDLVYVEVPRSGPARSAAVAVAPRPVGEPARATVDVGRLPLATGPDVGRPLGELLVRRGLRADEAAGLLAAWREAFFERPGRRVLVLLSPAQYDHLFPRVMVPAPTESVRVGIVVHEVGGP